MITVSSSLSGSNHSHYVFDSFIHALSVCSDLLLFFSTCSIRLLHFAGVLLEPLLVKESHGPIWKISLSVQANKLNMTELLGNFSFPPFPVEPLGCKIAFFFPCEPPESNTLKICILIEHYCHSLRWGLFLEKHPCVWQKGRLLAENKDISM